MRLCAQVLAHLRFTNPPQSITLSVNTMPRLSLLLSLLVGLFVLPALSVSPRAEAQSQEGAWYADNWQFRQKITVNHKRVAGPLAGFPMLVRMSGDIFQHAQGDGDDIVFTAADGTTKLWHEIESFDDELIAWVQVPHLSEQADTTLYVYYGNPQAQNQQRPQDVWDQTTYAGVWHLNQSPADTQEDATPHNRDGTPVNIDGLDGRAAGKIGPAVSFDGVEDYVDLEHAFQFGAEGITISLWINTTTTAGSFVFGTLDDGINSVIRLALNRNEDGTIAAGKTWWHIRADGGNTRNVSFSEDIYDGKWHHVTGIRDGATTSVFVDGQPVSLAVGFNDLLAGRTINTEYDFALGARNNRGVVGGFYEGDIDQVTISKVARSAAWIQTEYNNQCNCEQFLTIGNRQNQPVAAAASGTPTPIELTGPAITSINELFRTAYARGPTFAEWQYWATRIINNDKPTFPSLLGAMQWHLLFGENN